MVLISWFSNIVEWGKVKLPIKVATLKALRILRVLKSLHYIKGIQVILVTLGKVQPPRGLYIHACNAPQG